MEKHTAKELARYISQYSEQHHIPFEITPLHKDGSFLKGFHQWVEGKEVVDGFRVTKMGGDTYFVVLIDWHRNQKFYLVLYTHDKSTTVAEIREIIEHNGKVTFTWKYNPLKRDGRNAERKAFFKKYFGELRVQITFPRSSEEVEGFLQELFLLARNRILADQLVK